MRYQLLPLVVLAVTAALTAGAIAYLPRTAYYPVVEYRADDTVGITVYKAGELDQAACERSTQETVKVISAPCPQCRFTTSCTRGPDAAERSALSHDPIALPSVRQPVAALTMTITAKDPAVGLLVCQQFESQTAALPPNQRLTCAKPGTRR